MYTVYICICILIYSVYNIYTYILQAVHLLRCCLWAGQVCIFNMTCPASTTEAEVGHCLASNGCVGRPPPHSTSITLSA